MLKLGLALGFAFALSLGGCGSSDEESPKSSGGSSSGGVAGATGGSAGATGGSAGATGGSGGAAGSGAASGGGAAGSGATGGGDAGVDADGDGLLDSEELSLAEQYFPYYSLAPGDACPLHAVLFRATPNSDDPTKITIWYVVLFQDDCGALGHVGDDEVFGALIDPAVPPPAGILALRAISHQGTLCEKITTCGSLAKCSACTTASKNGKQFPVVYASKDKHGAYTDTGECALSCDFNSCALNPSFDTPKLLNAGEPGKPLTNDLTASGLITPANGWTKPELQNFDPWKAQDFGSAGDVSNDLVDTAFVVAPSGC